METHEDKYIHRMCTLMISPPEEIQTLWKNRKTPCLTTLIMHGHKFYYKLFSQEKPSVTRFPIIQTKYFFSI